MIRKYDLIDGIMKNKNEKIYMEKTVEVPYNKLFQSTPLRPNKNQHNSPLSELPLNKHFSQCKIIDKISSL